MKTKTHPQDYERRPGRNWTTSICCGCGREEVDCFPLHSLGRGDTEEHRCQICGCNKTALVRWMDLKEIQNMIREANVAVIVMDDDIDLLPMSTLDPEHSDYMDARGVGIRP